MKNFCFAAVAVAAFAVSPVAAATFTSSSSIDGGFSFCNVNTNTTAFATGEVLGYTPQFCLGGFTVSIDTVAQTITLTNIPTSPYGDYNFSTLEITGISEITITSLTTLQSDPLFNPVDFAPIVPVPGLSFTGSSILITFDSTATGSFFNFGNDGGQAIFQYNGAVVPEPATWAMLIAGFGLVGATVRRRKPVLRA